MPDEHPITITVRRSGEVVGELDIPEGDRHDDERLAAVMGDYDSIVERVTGGSASVRTRRRSAMNPGPTIREVAHEAPDPTGERERPRDGRPETTAERVLALQSTVGNRAVGQALAREVAGSPRERALARTVTQVRSRYSEARTRSSLGAYVGRGAFEVELTPLECMLTVRVRLVPDSGLPQTDVDQIKAETEAQFQRFWNEKFYFDDAATGERFFMRVRVLWVGSGQHVRVRLSRGPGRDNQTRWYIDGSDPVDRAHELSHTLGLRDEYIDSTVVRRRTATSVGVFQDHSLMGNYYNEGQANAEVKLRHGQQIADQIGRATRRTLTAGYSGPYQGERLVRWRGIRDAAAAGSAERTAADAEVAAIESDMLIPQLEALVHGTP